METMLAHIVCEVTFDQEADYQCRSASRLRLVTGFRSRELAEQKCAELNRLAKIDSPPWPYCPADEYPWNSGQLGAMHRIIGGYALESVRDVEERWTDLSDDQKLALWTLAEWHEDHFYRVKELDMEDCQVIDATAVR